MRAGQLRHRVTIQQSSQSQDEFGGTSDSWVDFKTRWASVQPIRAGSREFFDAERYDVEATHVIRMRHTTGITPKMRASYDNRTFDIQYVQNVGERDRETVLVTEESQ